MQSSKNISSSSSSDIEEIGSKIVPEKEISEYLIMCKTCLKKYVQIIFIPCHHACVCEDCYDKMPVPKICPICDTIIFRTYPIKIMSE